MPAPFQLILTPYYHLQYPAPLPDTILPPTLSPTGSLTLLVLDLLLDILNGVRALHLKCDGLASEGLDKDLHTTTQAQHQVKGAFLLDVVVSQGAAILQLLAGEDQTLLVWGNTCA